MHRRTIATLALPLLLLLLGGCDARRDFPPGITDVDLWRGAAIREDTEVPDQYPHGTTREARAAAGGDDAH